MFFDIMEDNVTKDFRQYKRVRKLSQALNDKILQTLPRKDFMEAEKKLGLSRKGKLIPVTEEELGIVLDYCLYNIYRRGMSNVQRYLQAASVSETELPLLEAMTMARYSVFQLLEVGSGYVILREFFTTQEYMVMDKNLSKSGAVGLMLAVRLIPYGRWCMTTGGGIPIVKETLDVITPIMAKFDRPHSNEGLEGLFLPAREANFAAQINRALLRANALGGMLFED